MRLALISDVHANLEALQATLADIAAQAADRIVCLGDIVGYNAKPAECIALIRDGKMFCASPAITTSPCAGGSRPRTSAPPRRAAVAWTRRRLTGDELAFLRGLPLKANIDDKLIAGARRASSRHRMRKRTAR